MPSTMKPLLRAGSAASAGASSPSMAARARRWRTAASSAASAKRLKRRVTSSTGHSAAMSAMAMSSAARRRAMRSFAIAVSGSSAAMRAGSSAADHRGEGGILSGFDEALHEGGVGETALRQERAVAEQRGKEALPAFVGGQIAHESGEGGIVRVIRRLAPAREADRSGLLVGGPRHLHRPHQGVALATGGELDQSVGVEVGEGELARLVLDHRIVDAGAAAADEAPRLA